MLIVLWGLASERPLAAVARQLDRLAAPFAIVNQHGVLETEAHLEVSDQVRGWIRTPRAQVALEEVTAAYIRAYDGRRVARVAQAGPESPVVRHAAEVDALLWSWAELTPALVINRPAAMASNNSKTFQVHLIRQLGFLVPATLVTTDLAVALEFWEEHGQVVYKSVSGIRSIVSRLLPEHAARLSDVTSCPTQFQAYVPGTDYRVHVVGDEVYACEIQSEATDYRYNGDHAVHVRACDLPAEVEDRCRELSVALQLPVVGIDLRRTPDGDWYCFEANPSPAFDFFERRAGLPIARAIARLLLAGETSTAEQSPTGLAA